MNDIKIKFHLFQNKCTISMDDAPLPRYSSLNNYVNKPLLEMAGILLQTLSDELNDEFSLTVTGTQFEQRFLDDLQKNHSDCASFKIEELGIGGELKERYRRTLKDTAMLPASGDGSYKEKVFSEVDLDLDARLAEVVSDPKNATICVASSPENSRQMARAFAGQLVLCVSDKNRVVCLNGNKYIWCVKENELSDVVEAVIEHFAIPRYIDHVAEIAKGNENTKVSEAINDQKKVDISISVNMKTVVFEGDEITPEFSCTDRGVTCPKVRMESANSNVVRVEGGKLCAVREGRAEIRFFRGNEIDAFEAIPVTVRPDDLVKVIYLSIPNKIKVGNKYKVEATFVPASASDISNAVWSSNNRRVVDVYSDGTFKAVSEGKATITVTTERSSESIEVVVIPSIEKIDLSANKVHLYIGEKKSLGVSLSPAGNLQEEIRAKSSNPRIAEITQNDLGDWIIIAKGIEAKGKGLCRIVFSSEDGKCQATCEVTVESTLTQPKGTLLSKSALFVVLAFVLQFFTKPMGYYGGIGCAAIAMLVGIVGMIKTRKNAFWQILLMIIAALILAVNYLLMTGA